MVIIFGASIYMTSCRAWIVTDEVQVVGDSELACLLQSMSGSDLDYAVESVHLSIIVVSSHKVKILFFFFSSFLY